MFLICFFDIVRQLADLFGYCFWYLGISQQVNFNLLGYVSKTVAFLIALTLIIKNISPFNPQGYEQIYNNSNLISQNSKLWCAHACSYYMV